MQTNRIGKTESLDARAQAFADAFDRVTSHPAVFAAIQQKLFEALCAWAVMKMGQERPRYLMEANRDFAVLCALRVLATNKSVEDVAGEVPFELPLKLTKQRTGFIELLPKLYQIAAEYEMVCKVAKSSKAGVRTAVQFRHNLHANLERFAEEEELKPAPTREKLDRLIEDYNLKSQPSEIAAVYVGKRHANSAANIKKLVGLIRDPARMQKVLGKYLKSVYVPPDFEAIKQSLIEP